MPKANKEMTYEDERACLDKARPSKSRVWPNNGMRFYSGWDENKRLRAVVCSTEDQAIQVFGDHVEVILMALGHYEPEDKVVWDAPGVEFIQTGFGPVVWEKSSERLTMLHYLASPYNHPAPEIMELRRVAACRKAGELIAEGIAVLSPIAHNVAVIREVGGETGWDRWQAQDLAMLSACKKVLVLRLPGWDTSKGVAAEINAATTMGIPVEYIDL